MGSPITDLLNGFGGLLAGAGIGLAYRNDGSAYLASEIPIFKGTERTVDGAQVILNWVSLSDEIEIPQGDGYLQVAVIGAPNDADSVNDIGYDIYKTIHGATNLVFGTITVVHCDRETSVPMGQDENVRNTIADHYRLDVEYPALPNIPS